MEIHDIRLERSDRRHVERTHQACREGASSAMLVEPHRNPIDAGPHVSADAMRPGAGCHDVVIGTKLLLHEIDRIDTGLAQPTVKAVRTAGCTTFNVGRIHDNDLHVRTA